MDDELQQSKSGELQTSEKDDELQQSKYLEEERQRLQAELLQVQLQLSKYLEEERQRSPELQKLQQEEARQVVEATTAEALQRQSKPFKVIEPVLIGKERTIKEAKPPSSQLTRVRAPTPSSRSAIPEPHEKHSKSEGKFAVSPAIADSPSDPESSDTEISSDTDIDDPIKLWYEQHTEIPESEFVYEISQFKRLPPQLQSLKIEGCDALESISDELIRYNSHLRQLYITDCHSLNTIQGSHLFLDTLYIRNCRNLKFVSSTEMRLYESLEHLRIESSCVSLIYFTLSLFPKLRNLSLCDCENLSSILIGMDHMSLEALEIRNCRKFIFFHDGRLRIPNLTSIVLSNCRSLKVLPGKLHSLKSLQSLFINDCPEIESIPEGGLPSSLNLVCISSCHKLTPRIEWGLHKLNSFSCIEIEGGCRDLESFPEQNLLPTTLTSLRISRIVNLKSLDYKGLEHLTSLETLKIITCNKLQSFPEDGLPSSLTCLYISDCPLLKSKLQNRRGKEWFKIAHIPHIEIDGEVIS